MKKNISLLMLVGALLFSVPARANPLVTNGGFETGDFTGWDVQLAPPADTFIGVDNKAPHSGTFGAFFGSIGADDSISQNIIGTTAGTNYVVDYFLAHNFHPSSPPNDFAATWNGADIPGSVFVDASDFGQTEMQFTVVGTGSDVLGFRGADPVSFWDLDDVSFVPEIDPAVAAVPLSLALGSLMLLSDGRKTKES